ncbi:MAG: DUF4416 family protein [Candidatus Omnitrophica bacterium]|nr:DUF4416 family protein [Candidatus Omnitrophota bacterium]
MGAIRNSPSVKLIIAFIFQDTKIFEAAQRILVKRFGPLDFESERISFTYTDYYEAEMGSNLQRVFISFKKLIDPSRMASIKTATNAIERKFSRNNKRAINIDPGYLTLAKLVLASTKDFAHRIYLSHGIFAETTLIFKDKSFRPLEWTYPDFKTEPYLRILENIRQLYHEQIRSVSIIS